MNFRDFPQKRTELSEEYEKVYSKYRRQNRDGATSATFVAQRMEQWLHKQVAADLHDKFKDGYCGQVAGFDTLEIGAGTLNQLDYEVGDFIYDVIEPIEEMYLYSKNKSRIRTLFADILEVPPQNKYDRITSVASFEHILNLPALVAVTGLLLNQNGSLRVAIPSEGTILWTLGWKLTTGLEFRMKYGLDFGVLVEHEHVNSAKDVETVLSYFYEEIKCKVFGISRALSFYQFFECKKPLLERCNEFSTHTEL